MSNFTILHKRSMRVHLFLNWTIVIHIPDIPYSDTYTWYTIVLHIITVVLHITMYRYNGFLFFLTVIVKYSTPCLQCSFDSHIEFSYTRLGLGQLSLFLITCINAVETYYTKWVNLASTGIGSCWSFTDIQHTTCKHFSLACILLINIKQIHLIESRAFRRRSFVLRVLCEVI